MLVDSFILHHRNAAPLPIYRSFIKHHCATNISISIYRSSTQRTASQVEMNAMPQCSSWCRDGNNETATYRNADAVHYRNVVVGAEMDI